MNTSRILIALCIFLSCLASKSVPASKKASETDIKNVERARVENAADRERLQQAAVLLANYEIEAGKLVARLDNNDVTGENIQLDATRLLSLSEEVIESAQFRLPQCDEYLAKTVALKGQLDSISHESLEHDYHHDGALPKAPAECYHTKDLFVHPATVIVLTRDDPALATETRENIKAEINEVLAHTEVVRQLVFY